MEEKKPVSNANVAQKKMKSKMPEKPTMVPIPTNPQQQQQQQQVPVMNNAQQQQFQAVQSNVFQQQQQQVPMQFQQNQMPVANNLQFPVQQTAYSPVIQAPVGNVGYYGRRNVAPQYQELPQYFNDDEPIAFQKYQKEAVKQEIKDEAKLEIQIKAQRSMIKLKEAVTLPAMCSIKTSGGVRTSVDLICVIDVSGSMDGEKINLVKDTMKFLIQTMTPTDRLSIITFNSSGFRICPLRCVTPENIVNLNNNINGLFASGGTNIMSGLDLALRTIRDRKMPNKATSVFLLSDGQDKGAENQFKTALALPENKELGVFSIHSFGFGTDHDEDLMTKICQMKDGSFYFIKQLATLDEAFCNALGGIISMVASEVIIKINLIAKDLMSGVKINRCFGPMWFPISDKEYTIKLTQLMSGISKDFVFQLSIPAILAEVGDLERDHDIIEGIFTAVDVNKKQLSGQCCFKITLLNQNEEIPEINQNVDVIENYLRVKAADVIEENMKKAEKHQYQEAQQGIDEMIHNIQGNKKARKEKMEFLVNDLQQIRQKCSKKQYEGEGKKWMVNAKAAHSNQQNYQYSNKMQNEMVMERKMKKMG